MWNSVLFITFYLYNYIVLLTNKINYQDLKITTFKETETNQNYTRS